MPGEKPWALQFSAESGEEIAYFPLSTFLPMEGMTDRHAFEELLSLAVALMDTDRGKADRLWRIRGYQEVGLFPTSGMSNGQTHRDDRLLEPDGASYSGRTEAHLYPHQPGEPGTKAAEGQVQERVEEACREALESLSGYFVGRNKGTDWGPSDREVEQATKAAA